ncbi:hypothetical protein [Oenococcus alcoholitolerans]|uniref:hypothetical protein n=1 Tax=Oenococcus alcoholitolerans TaxID=931074 RepID=UPI003F7106EA
MLLLQILSIYNTIQAAVYLHSASARSLSQQYYTTQPSQVTDHLAELMAQAAKKLPKDSSGLE